MGIAQESEPVTQQQPVSQPDRPETVSPVRKGLLDERVSVLENLFDKLQEEVKSLKDRSFGPTA